MILTTNDCDYRSTAVHSQGDSLQAVVNRMFINAGNCGVFSAARMPRYRNHDTDVTRRVPPVSSMLEGQGTRSDATVPEVRAARVNRMCVDFLDRVGLAGWWTDAGPSPLANLAAAAGRRKSRLARGQFTALHLAFFAWRFELIHARLDYWPLTVADLMKLDRRTLRHATAFMRGFSRLVKS